MSEDRGLGSTNRDESLGARKATLPASADSLVPDGARTEAIPGVFWGSPGDAHPRKRHRRSRSEMRAVRPRLLSCRRLLATNWRPPCDVGTSSRFSSSAISRQDAPFARARVMHRTMPRGRLRTSPIASSAARWRLPATPSLCEVGRSAVDELPSLGRARGAHAAPRYPGRTRCCSGGLTQPE